jgi:DNA-binding XRE family transcriptional regulator
MAEAIEARAMELGLTPGTFAESAGVTRQGLAPIRRGYRRQYQAKLKLGVARALAWPPDAIDRLMAGDDPATFERPTAGEVDYNSRIARMPEHVRRTIDDLIDQFEAQERR